MTIEVPQAVGAHEGIIRAYKEHQDLLIFALTGRTGSGCTTAAELLSSPFDTALTEHFKPASIELRKRDIVVNFAEKNWIPFTRITVSTLLIALLAEDLAGGGSLPPGLDPLGDEASDVRHELDAFYAANKNFLQILNMRGEEFRAASPTSIADAVRILQEDLPELLVRFKSLLGQHYSALMQTIGDNVRASGKACSSQEDPTALFRLPQAIVRSIECIRERDKSLLTSTRIVIDAIRNPLELVYLRDRYSTFYAIAITADEDDRKDRLLSMGISQAAIESLDEREYPKKHSPLSAYHKVITQDIQSCLQKADIFVSNSGRHSESSARKRAMNAHLYGQLLRYYSLALHPGLVTPTRDERCMQIALVAKLNSGCISRQVGAAVTDSEYVVRAIGWNDVPRGQVPCALRNVDALNVASDETAYSEYERTKDELRSHVISTHSNRATKLEAVGLPCPYCFKDAANESVFANKEERIKGTNQVHTRSLHAEENAFLQLTSSGSSGVKGGRLYTTASPCELCSKKAYQLGIADVIYIDPYPGISVPQIMLAGTTGTRPSLRLFNGAVGKAYHRLYEAMMPIKDEIKARLQ